MTDTGRAAVRADEGAPHLPDDSVLSLSEYLELQKTIGNETRFRVVNRLLEAGPQSSTELREALGPESNTLHYHLDRLVEVGLV